MFKDIPHFVVVVEQAVAVQRLRLPHRRRDKSVGADDLQILVIPQNQMQVVIIKAVGVAALPAAFPHRAKGNLPQTPQLAQDRGLFLAVTLPQIDGFAIGGGTQRFRLRQLALQGRPVFRSRNGRFGFEYPRQPLAETQHVLAALLGHLPRGKRGAEPVTPANLLADFDRQAAVAAAKHLLHQQQHRQVRGEQGAGIEQQAVAGVDVDRQQRRAKFARQLDKARVPLFIADACARRAGDFPRREEDQHAGMLQMLLHQGERRFRRPPADVIHRDKQRA